MGSENLTKAQECGIRCRQIRMAKNMRQQELADKLHVTPQAISKWEKEGISNIDIIQQVSDALGQDITADQIDQEGAIGEVGKEIIRILIENGGYVDFELLERSLFGMASDRISNEIFKIERIGAAIREQFKDFCNEERDGIFVTAKGVIAYKNNTVFVNSQLINNVITMDTRLGGCNKLFQDIVDSDKITKLLMNCNILFYGFRCDYLKYLYRHFFRPIINHSALGTITDVLKKTDGVLYGESCYIDIIRRMAQNISVREVENLIEDICIESYFEECYSGDDELQQKAVGLDDFNIEAVQYFCTVIDSMPAYSDMRYTEDDWSSDRDDADIKWAKDTIEEEAEYEDRFKDYVDDYSPEAVMRRMKKNEEAFFGSMDDAVKKNSNRWFTEDEVKKFIEKNILPPNSDQEKEIDKKLKEIWKTYPASLKYYYSFPKTWEKNGIAQLIRDKVGVPNIK